MFTVGLLRNHNPNRRSFTIASAVLFISLFLLAGHLYHAASSAPFFILASLIPGVSLAGLPWSLLGFSIVCCAVPLFCSNSRSIAVGLVAVVAIALLGCRLQGWHQGFPTLYWQDNLLRSAADTEQPGRAQVLPLIEKYGAWIVEPGVAEHRQFSNLERLQRGEDFDWIATANVNQQDANLALDGNVFTRWQTGRSQQGGDHYQITFSEPISVLRVVLSVKDNPAEYPRGIRVLGGDSENEFREILQQPQWQGPVLWTKDGVPYIGAYHQVVLDFPKQEQVQVLRFEQLVDSNSAHWSINEVKLYAEKDGNSSQSAW